MQAPPDPPASARATPQHGLGLELLDEVSLGSEGGFGVADFFDDIHRRS